MKKKFTDKDYSLIKENNSKDDPFDISKYDLQSLIEWHKLKGNSVKYFWITFICKKCKNKVIKHIDSHFNTRTTINTLINCEDCNRKQSIKNHYGVDNIFKSKKMQAKIKRQNISKYGVDNPAKSQEIKNKIKKTNLKKYGCENVFQNKDVKNKIKQTNLKKYGETSFTKTSEYTEKRKDTCKKKYGVEHFSKTKEYKEKFKKTMHKKYGVDHALKNDKLLAKAKETCFKKYGFENYTKSDIYKQYMLDTYGTLSIRHSYKYDDILFESSWELAFYLYHKDKGHKIIKEPCYFSYVYNKQVHHYFPDFKVGNRYYEIKGNQFLKFYKNGKIKTLICVYDETLNGLYNAKYKCMKQHKVKIITSVEIKKYLDYVNKYYEIEKFKLN